MYQEPSFWPRSWCVGQESKGSKPSLQNFECKVKLHIYPLELKFVQKFHTPQNLKSNFQVPTKVKKFTNSPKGIKCKP